MQDKKEIIEIYNVTQNDKDTTPISKDIEIVENNIIEYIVMYVKDYDNIKKDSSFGAGHIKIHLEKHSEGRISLEELVNLGNSLRDYAKLFNKPFIDDNGAKIYEWEDSKGVRFRTIVDRLKREGLQSAPLSPFDEQIIIFYSDRNLKEKMTFKNKEVEEYYKKLHTTNA